MNSLAKLILRVVAWLLVTAGLISSELGEFVVNDPDVLVVTTMVVSALALEVGLGIRKWKRFRARRNAALGPK